MVINDLIVDGFKVLIAHPERSGFLVQRREMLERIVSRGVLCSVTAASFNGDFGRSVRKQAIDLAEAGLVHNISSDAHDLKRRTPGISVDRESIRGLLWQGEFDRIASGLLGLDDQPET
jgi:protein-tyrosine phosphatase